MSVAYPANVPVPSADLSLQIATGLMRFRSESGRVRTAGGSGSFQFSGTFAWDLLESEYLLFLAWWRDSLKAGTLPFDLPIDTGGGILNHTVQMVTVPSFTNKIKGKLASAGIVITNRPDNVSASWHTAYNSIPALWPTGYVPGPNQSLQETLVKTFYATSLPPSAASPMTDRGTQVKLTFTFRPSELNYFLSWFKVCLLFGRKSFIASFADYLDQEYILLDDLQINTVGYNYSCSMTCLRRASSGTRPGNVGWGFNWGNDWGGA